MTHLYYRAFLKDNIIVTIGHILVYARHIILMPLIVKTVGVTIYGGFVLLTSLLGIAFGISSFGSGYRAQRFLPSAKNMDERAKLFYPQFFFRLQSVLLFSLLFIVFNQGMQTYIFKHQIDYSVFFIPVYLVSYFFYAQGSDYFRYTSRVPYMTIITAAFPYLEIGLILLFFYFYRSLNINTLLFVHAFSAFLVAVPCFTVIFRELGFRFLCYKINNLIQDIRLGFPLVLNFIVDFILAGSDRYVIALYMTVSAVGYYNSGYLLGSLIIFIPKAIGTALPQLMSKAVDEQNDFEAQRMLNYAIKIFLLFAIPVVFGTITLSRPLLTLLANADVASEAHFITPIVALGILFYGLNIILSNAFFVRMETSAMFKINVIASMVNLAANLVFLYFFRNIAVAAGTTFLSYFIAFCYAQRMLKNQWPVDFSPAVILKAIASAFFMTIILFLTLCHKNMSALAAVGWGLPIGITAYIGGLFLFKTFSDKELLFVKQHIFRKGLILWR